MDEEKVTQPEAEGEAVAEVPAEPASVPEARDDNARIAELEKMVADLQKSAQKREAEILLSRTLRERGLQEDFTPLLLADGELTLTEDEARNRVALVEKAVCAAAERMFRAQIQPTRPQVGDPNPHPLTPEVIRALPLARLAEAMGSGK